MKRFALLLTAAFSTVFSLAAIAGDDWKPPEDGVVTEQHVKDYLTYLAALRKVGGTWHAQTVHLVSTIEQKGINEAAIPRLELQWVKPRVNLIATHLVLEHAMPELWAAAEKRANEKL